MKDIVLRSPRHAVRRISSAGSRDRSVASHDFGNFDLVKQRAHGSHLDLLFRPERPRVANCNVVLDARADIAVYKVEDMEIFVLLKGAEAYLECRNREDWKLNFPRVSITWGYMYVLVSKVHHYFDSGTAHHTARHIKRTVQRGTSTRRGSINVHNTPEA